MKNRAVLKGENAYIFGLSCKYSKGENKDIEEASKWYKIAARQRHQEAQSKLKAIKRALQTLLESSRIKDKQTDRSFPEEKL